MRSWPAILLSWLPVRTPLNASTLRCGALACLSAGDWEGLPHRHDLRTWAADADPVER